MRYALGSILMVVLSLGICLMSAGCKSTPGSPPALTPVQIAQITLDQLSATIDSAEAVSAILSKSGQPNRTVEDAKVVLAVLKPQIAALLHTIETIQLSQKQAADAAALKAKAAGLP